MRGAFKTVMYSLVSTACFKLLAIAHHANSATTLHALAKIHPTSVHLLLLLTQEPRSDIPSFRPTLIFPLELSLFLSVQFGDTSTALSRQSIGRLLHSC